MASFIVSLITAQGIHLAKEFVMCDTTCTAIKRQTGVSLSTGLVMIISFAFVMNSQARLISDFALVLVTGILVSIAYTHLYFVSVCYLTGTSMKHKGKFSLLEFIKGKCKCFKN